MPLEDNSQSEHKLGEGGECICALVGEWWGEGPLEPGAGEERGVVFLAHQDEVSVGSWTAERGDQCSTTPHSHFLEFITKTTLNHYWFSNIIIIHCTK